MCDKPTEIIQGDSDRIIPKKTTLDTMNVRLKISSIKMNLERRFSIDKKYFICEDIVGYDI